MGRFYRKRAVAAGVVAGRLKTKERRVVRMKAIQAGEQFCCCHRVSKRTFNEGKVETGGCLAGIGRDRTLEQMNGLGRLALRGVDNRKIGQRSGVESIKPQRGLILSRRPLNITRTLVQIAQLSVQGGVVCARGFRCQQELPGALAHGSITAARSLRVGQAELARGHGETANGDKILNRIAERGA